MSFLFKLGRYSSSNFTLQLHLIAELTISSPFFFKLGVSHFESLDSTPISGIVDERSSYEASLLITISGVPAINEMSSEDFSSDAQNISSNFSLFSLHQIGELEYIYLYRLRSCFRPEYSIVHTLSQVELLRLLALEKFNLVFLDTIFFSIRKSCKELINSKLPVNVNFTL